MVRFLGLMLLLAICVSLLPSVLGEPEQLYRAPTPKPEPDRGAFPVVLFLIPVLPVAVPVYRVAFRSFRSYRGMAFEVAVPVAYYRVRIGASSRRARIARSLARLFHWYTNGYYKRG